MTTRTRTRRRFLTATSAIAAVVAGCLGGDGEGDDPEADDEPGDDTTPDLPQVEDPPDVVYIPSHREGMQMLDPVEAGEYVVEPMLSYAHPFWLVTGQEVEPVEVGSDEDVHLMATLRDAETGTVLPITEGLFVEVYRDGEPVDSRPPWPMLSQSMGFHFGDNVPLDGDGTYEARVEIPPLTARTAGAFEGRFEEPATATFEFTYDDEVREALVEDIEWTPEEHWGEPGAAEPMHGGHDGEGGEHGDDHDGEHGDHGMAFSSLPPAEDLPGTLQGVPVTGDADFATTVVEGFGGAEQYLLVSPRTPYNRVPLPGMSLSARIERDGDEVAAPDLLPTLHDEAGFHYGAAIPDAAPGDALEIVVDAPPQTARHQGYETAFVDMPTAEVTLDDW